MNTGVICLLVFFSLIFSATTQADDAPQAEWRLDVDKQNIKVFTRPLDDSNIRAFKAVTLFEDVTLSQLTAVILDMQQFDQWMDNAGETRLLETLGPGRQITYFVNKVPLFLKDRDIVIGQTVKQDPETGEVTISLSSHPEFLPESDRYVRVKEFGGAWVLTPMSDDRIQLTYRVHFDPAGALPGFVVNMLLTSAPYKSLKNLREQQPWENYESTDLAFVTDRPPSLSRK